MRHYNLDISRRKLLGAMGTIGGAAALSGASTMAFFSDEEEFANNELVAGEFDMMVDWAEHYSDWSDDENDDRTDEAVIDLLETSVDEDESDTDLDSDGVDDFEVVMTDGDPDAVPDGYVGFPVPMEPLIAIPSEFVDDFMANTGIDALPDSDDDGIQDTIYTRDQLSGSSQYTTEEEIEEAFRSQFANLDVGLDSDARTESSRGDPLIDLTDVKPGDFGEVTLSIHLFNNPGYVWLTGGLRANAENGYTEPERTDPDEDLSGPDGAGELVDEIRTAVWHDSGDNVLQMGAEAEVVHSPHDVDRQSNITLSQSEALIFEGTLRQLLDRLETGGIPLDADTRDDERDCFDNSTTRYICLAWWLPVDHANEIQTDRVAFDLGFYTEQCRHNDGSGLANRNG